LLYSLLEDTDLHPFLTRTDIVWEKGKGSQGKWWHCPRWSAERMLGKHQAFLTAQVLSLLTIPAAAFNTQIFLSQKPSNMVVFLLPCKKTKQTTKQILNQSKILSQNNWILSSHIFAIC